jgi:hypothetical protein
LKAAIFIFIRLFFFSSLGTKAIPRALAKSTDGETVGSGIHERICEEEPIVFADFSIPAKTIDSNIYC